MDPVCVPDGQMSPSTCLQLLPRQRMSVSCRCEAERYSAVWMGPVLVRSPTGAHQAAPACRLPGICSCERGVQVPLPSGRLCCYHAGHRPRAGWVFPAAPGACLTHRPLGPRARGGNAIGQAGDPEPQWIWGSIGGSLPGHLPAPPGMEKDPPWLFHMPGAQTGALGGTPLPGVAPRAKPKQVLWVEGH